MSLESIAISDLMSRNVLVAEQDLNIYGICRILSNNNIGCVVVVDDLETRKPVGIITESDIIKVMGKLDQHQLQVPIKNFMSTPVFTLSSKASTADAMKLMCDKKIRVVILENDNLVGIVTDKDLLRCLMQNRDIMSSIASSDSSLPPKQSNDDFSHFWFCNSFIH
ncbi:MAG: cyclic nucleotide-binding/CBS domain-containing protein [Candidatus Nitrosocosmicus sp.]